MLDFTPLLRPYFAHIVAQRAKWSTPAGLESVQRALLQKLLHRAADTVQGLQYDYGKLRSYNDYASAVPVSEYEDIRPLVERMLAGEADILWPGQCRRFAQSSGTSGGKSKYIPVTDAALKLNHYAGGAQAVASYLSIAPHSRLFGGKSFILGGSFANELGKLPPGTLVGDLSANLIDAINPAVNLLRIPRKSTALLSDWNVKLPALVEASLKADITNISGVPSWFLGVLRGVLERTGASNIHEVWPNLEVFFHGGISFAPYREEYNSIMAPGKMCYIENYNASEGFFAVQDTADSDKGMLLLADSGIFFEFVPLDSLSQTSAAIPAWEVEEGRTYALLISSCNGLWRYSPGDTVRIESTLPLRISVAGRTNSYINAFGEELMVWNAEAAMARACAATGARVANYTAAPVYTSCRTKGHHQWLVEWTTPPACGTEKFADILDRELQAVNSDYQAKRSSDIFLARLELVTVPPGTFNAWLKSTGRLGGQRKIPRLNNDRRIADAILQIADKNTNP